MVASMTKPAAQIDPNEFGSLNREFYAADPAEVIQHRLWMLSQFIADESVEVKCEAEDLAAKREVPDLNERVQFVTLESTLVLHQAAETLLRLYMAHSNDAHCPWVEMTMMRAPGAFGRRVRALRSGLESDRVIRDVLDVVSWSGDRRVVEASVTWHEKGGWTRHREGLRALFRFACDVVLDGADLYNAGKHGLAILPAQRGMKIDDGEVIAVDGPSLTVIEPQEHDGSPRWAKTTRWVKYKREIMMTAYLAAAIGSLWACGKQRRTGDGDQSQIRFFDVDELTEAMHLGSPMGINVSTMSQLLFDLDHPMWTPNPPGQQNRSQSGPGAPPTISPVS